MTRREKGSGAIHQIKPGTYRLRLFIGLDPVTGKRRSVSKTIQAKNITAARKELASFVAEHRSEKVGSSMTVERLMAEYIASLEAKRRAPLTISAARRATDQVIVPVIGKVEIDKLEGRHIDQIVRNHSDLKVASVRRYIAVLSAALGLAVKQGWIDRNPVVQASLPEGHAKRPRYPSKEEVAVLIERIPGDVWKMAIRLATMTAARRGEVCALRWTDLEDGRVLWLRRSVYRENGRTVERQDTKGGEEREIVLSESGRADLYLWAMECLRRAEEIGITLAPDSFILSPRPDGLEPLNPDTLSSHVYRVTRELGWTHVHFHGIRHLGATEMIASGVNVATAAAILGHKDGGKLLLSTYAHPTTERQKAAGAVLGGLLTGP